VARDARDARKVSALQACGDDNADDTADADDDHDFEDWGVDVNEIPIITDDDDAKDDEDFNLRIVSMMHRMPINDIKRHGENMRSSDDTQLVGTIRTAFIAAITQQKETSLTNPERLSVMWGIGLASAQKTLGATTQDGTRCSTDHIHRRFKTKQAHLRYPSINTTVYSDTLFAKDKGIGGDKCAQVFTTDFDYVQFYPMKKKHEAGHKLAQLLTSVGIMRKLVTDGAPEQQGGEWGKVVSDFHIQQSITEPYSSWQNRAEMAIKRLKRGIRYHTKRKGSPKRLWNYCGLWVADILRCTATTAHGHDGRTPEEIMTGNTPDIGQYLMFDWYDTVEYHVGKGQSSDFPEERSRLGKWIGLSHNVGQALCFYILTEKCTIISRTTVINPSDDRKSTAEFQTEQRQLVDAISERIGDHISDGDVDADGDPQPAPDLFEDDGDYMDETIVDPVFDKPEADEFTAETFDKYLTANVLLPRGDSQLKGKVVARARDSNNNPVGKANNNPILDTREYEVQFPDGSMDVYTANIIAENLYSQVMDDGSEMVILEEIIDHRKDGSAVSKDDMYVRSYNGTLRKRQTTQGWKLLVRWRDGTEAWVALRNIKESNPIEVAEYAINNKLAEEPAFTWWIKDVIRKRDRMVGKAMSRYWLKSHKYGIELPKSVKEALQIDRTTGTNYWELAIQKEMKNVMIAFEFNNDDKVPPGYKFIKCHMVFDVKMDLTRKARYVAGGHMTDPPKDSSYSSVVSRDSVRLAFLLAALNDLDILAADIQNAYLYARTKEKVYTTAGLEFGQSMVGRPVLIVRALYGLRTSGAQFRSHLAQTLSEFGYRSSKADPDVWMRPETKPDGTKYYAYVLVYVDDILCVHHKPQELIEMLRKTYKLKEGSVGPPTVYLGAEIKPYYLPDSDEPGKARWSMSSEAYVKRAVQDVETELGKVDLRLPTKVSTPLACGYFPELDQTTELDDKRGTYYMGLIGVLRWTVELGRIDIAVDVSRMSSFMASPREGHLQQLFHIFAYLKNKPRSTLVFDDSYPDVDQGRFKQCDWGNYYPDAVEAVPPNAPEPRGKEVGIHCFVDANHGGCRVTRRSHTGVLIYCNKAPIIWFTKRQNTVECATFGSEFIALRVALELIEGLRYKLRMLGVPIAGSADVFCDNEGVVKNTTAPESTLKKKHTAINYHRVREAVANGTIRIAKEDTKTNLADMLTKSLPGVTLRELSKRIFY
jgi:hypothetical protein